MVTGLEATSEQAITTLTGDRSGWIAASREGLKGSVRARLEAQFGQLPAEEFDSLFRLVYEELDLSVTALLRNSAQLGPAAEQSADEPIFHRESDE